MLDNPARSPTQAAIAQVAMRLHSAVPNTGGQERYFSKYNIVHTHVRSRLQPERVRKVVVVRSDLADRYGPPPRESRKRKIYVDDDDDTAAVASAVSSSSASTSASLLAGATASSTQSTPSEHAPSPSIRSTTGMYGLCGVAASYSRAPVAPSSPNSTPCTSSGTEPATSAPVPSTPASCSDNAEHVEDHPADVPFSAILQELDAQRAETMGEGDGDADDDMDEGSAPANQPPAGAHVRGARPQNVRRTSAQELLLQHLFPLDPTVEMTPARESALRLLDAFWGKAEWVLDAGEKDHERVSTQEDGATHNIA
jgi:hypothetical protein